MQSFLKSLRLISLTATFTPWLASLLIAKANGSTINWTFSLLAIAGILALQLAVNLFNDVADFKKGIDKEGEFGGSGVLVSNEMSSKSLTLWASFFAIIASVLGAYLMYQIPQLLWIALGGAFFGLFYSLPFFGFKYLALGDLCVFIGCGPVLMMGYALCNGALFPEHYAIGTFFGLYAIGILHVNNMEDIKIDTEVKVKTIATLLGFQKSKAFLVAVYALGSLALLYSSLYQGLSLYPVVIHLLALPLGLKIMMTMIKAQTSEDPSIKLLRINAAQYHLASGVLVCAGLVVQILL
jgi:1,4-dihydroxy-2-naphthoate octaprenyltransferase